MTTELLPPPTEFASEPGFAEFETPAPVADSKVSFAEQLRIETAGVRLTRRVFWAKRSLSRTQVAEAAAPFHADAKLLAASRKILDTNSADYAQVTSIIRQARQFWLQMSVDYPVMGIRLIRKNLLPVFEENMQRSRAQLQEALARLADSYAAMREEARERLGELYDPSDYPDDLTPCFSIEWDYPNVEPPDYLQKLNPELYEQERQRVAARFEEAVKLAEEAYAVELQKLVSYLVDRLTGTDEDGKPKTFKKSAVENLSSFFEQFKTTAIKCNPDLDELVTHAQSVLQGVDPNELRKDASKRDAVARDMAQVAQLLDGMLINRPTRAISLEDD